MQNVGNIDVNGVLYAIEDAEARGVMSGRNLLHNWDFRNPVNQRGQNEYISSGLIYSIDRWVIGSYQDNAKLQIMTEGSGRFIRFFRHSNLFNPPFRQTLEHPGLFLGKTVTLSAVVRSQTTAGLQILGVVGRIVPNWTLVSRTFTLESTGEITIAQFLEGLSTVGDHIDIQAVKLELGPVSTLANDPPMDFGRELAICQRYQLGGFSSYTAIRARSLYPSTITFQFFIPQSLRGNPRFVPQFGVGNLDVAVEIYNFARIGGNVFGGLNSIVGASVINSLLSNLTEFIHIDGNLRLTFNLPNHNLTDPVFGFRGVIFDANL